MANRAILGRFNVDSNGDDALVQYDRAYGMAARYGAVVMHGEWPYLLVVALSGVAQLEATGYERA